MSDQNTAVLLRIELLLRALLESSECKCHPDDPDNGLTDYQCPRCVALKGTTS